MGGNADRFSRFALVFCAALIAIGLGSAEELGDAFTPITVNLTISKIPVLNESADLHCKVSSIYDAKNTTVRIQLPEGSELVNGSLAVKLDLMADRPDYLNATVKFTRSGDFTIKATAYHMVDAENSWGDLKALYLTIGQNRSMFTPGPSYWSYAVQSEPGNATVIPTNITRIPINATIGTAMSSAQELPGVDLNYSSELNGTQPSSSSSLMVKGRWRYKANTEIYRPAADALDWARYFLVKVERASDKRVLGSGYIDKNGYFSIEITNPGSDGFQVILYAYAKFKTGSTELRIVSNEVGGKTGLNYVWNWATRTMTASEDDRVTNIGTWDVDDDYKACWLLSDLIKAWSYVNSNTPDNAGPATIVWYSTSTQGTFYRRGGQIFLTGEDPASASTTIHEYGHNVMYNAYNNWMPTSNCPSPHYVTRKSHVNCAWTEGWANFFSILVNRDPTYWWSSGSKRNFETPTWGTPSWDDGPEVEGRVAGALWDIYDNVDDGDDEYCLGFDKIENLVFTQKQTNFADFRSQWLSKSYSKNVDKCIYQNTIDNPPNAPSEPSGTSSGYAEAAYSYATSAKDPDSNQLKLTIDWGDGTTSETGFIESGQRVGFSHIWSKAGRYQVKAMATDSNGESSDWSNSQIVKIGANDAPGTPTAPSGTNNGKANKIYRYSTSSTDSNGDRLKYTFDWGDGRTTTTSWTKPGSHPRASYKWSGAGIYEVKVRAMDSKDAVSEWSEPLVVTIT